MMRKILLLFIFLFCFNGFVFAQPDEFVQISRSKYFVIYSQEKVSLSELVRRFNIRSEYLLLNPVSSSERDVLGQVIDAIFLEVCDALHMYLYNFQGNLKICRNQKELDRLFDESFDHDGRRVAFYIHKINSIYIDARRVDPETLAYEIARAIISRYFVVLPPAGVQEILAMDAGCQIGKLAK